jgi:hypothetical protein
MASAHKSRKESITSDFRKKDSEMWHAKAMHITCTFLPTECPLVVHIISSYIKHHLKQKTDTREKELKIMEEARKKKKIESETIAQ